MFSAHLSVLKECLEKTGHLLARQLQDDFAAAANAQTLEASFRRHQPYWDAYLEFMRPHLREEKKQQLLDAIDALTHDATYYEEVKKIATELSTAFQTLEERLKAELSIETLQGLATAYQHKTLESQYRALFTGIKDELSKCAQASKAKIDSAMSEKAQAQQAKMPIQPYDDVINQETAIYQDAQARFKAVNLVSTQFNHLPGQFLIWDAQTSAYQCVTRGAYIREIARAKLEDKIEQSRNSNIRNLHQVPATFTYEHMQAICKEDEAYIRRIRAKRKALYTVDSFFREDFNKKLKYLYKEKFLWFSPGFQASSIRQAKNMREQYRLVAHATEALVAEFTQQQLAIEERLHSLPLSQDITSVGGDPKLTQLLQTHRIKLEKRLQKIKKDLEVPQAVLIKLFGTGRQDAPPLERNGVLETMNEALLAKTGLQLMDNTLLNVSYQDYCPNAIPKALKPTDLLTTLSAPGTTIQTGQDYFKEVSSVPLGKLRVYEVSTPAKINPLAGQPNQPAHFPAQVVGRFTEARSGDYRKPNNQISILTFPTATGLQPRPQPNELHEFRVEFAMAIMMQILMNLEHEPSEAHPLHLSGCNAEELKYLTSAALVVQEMLGKKISHKALEIHSGVPRDFPNVGWQQTLGIASEGIVFKKNKADGFYESFKASPHVANLTPAFKALMVEKFIPVKREKKLRESEHRLMRMEQVITRHGESMSKPLARMP